MLREICKYAKLGIVRIKDRGRKGRLAVAGVLLKLKKIQQMEVVWVEEKADEVTDGLVRCMHRAAMTPISKMCLYNKKKKQPIYLAYLANLS